MVVLANGFPKSGTNLIKKVLGALGHHHEKGLLMKQLPDHKILLTKYGGHHPASEDGPSPLPTRPIANPCGHHPLINALFEKDNCFIHSHVGWTEDPRIDKIVHITRNPRNASLSFLRWAKARGRGLDYTRTDLRNLLSWGLYDYGAWLRAMVQFHEWTDDPRACCVRFEDICTDGGESVSRILKYLGEPNQQTARIYAGLYGNGKQIDGVDVYEGLSTWTGELSDWTTCPWWDEDLWNQFDGPAIEKVLGY